MTSCHRKWDKGGAAPLRVTRVTCRGGYCPQPRGGYCAGCVTRGRISAAATLAGSRHSGRPLHHRTMGLPAAAARLQAGTRRNSADRGFIWQPVDCLNLDIDTTALYHIPPFVLSCLLQRTGHLEYLPLPRKLSPLLAVCSM